MQITWMDQHFPIRIKYVFAAHIAVCLQFREVYPAFVVPILDGQRYRYLLAPVTNTGVIPVENVYGPLRMPRLSGSIHARQWYKPKPSYETTFLSQAKVHKDIPPAPPAVIKAINDKFQQREGKGSSSATDFDLETLADVQQVRQLLARVPLWPLGTVLWVKPSSLDESSRFAAVCLYYVRCIRCSYILPVH